MPKNVNKHNTIRDNLGRTLSNVITSIPLADFQLTNVDVLEQDLESGFNPIHQSLNSGYIHKAFLLNEAFKKKKNSGLTSGKKKSTGNIDKKNTSNEDSNSASLKTPWKLRDNDGETPMELYYNKYFYMNKTLQQYSKNEKLCKLYVFGKIINIELGLGSNNDSLEEIHLQGMIIQEIQLNKTRAVLIDDYKRMYILKLKHLGEIIEKQNGTHLKKNEDYSLKKYLQEPFPNEQFSKVYMSDTHTLAVTINEQLLSFGDDEYGQCSSTPSSIKSYNKGIVMNVGCSNVSSCVLTSKNELISWGLNTGQFGISELNSKNNSSTLKLMNQGNQSYKVKEVNYKTHKSFMSTKPFVYQLPKDTIGEVRQLIHLDYATIILHGDNGLLVLTQYRELHFFIPNLGKKELSFNHFISERMTGVNKVERLYVKGEYGSQVVCKFYNGVLGLLDLNDSLNAMSDDEFYIHHDKLKNKDIENMWNRQRFQLPMKILFKPNIQMQKNYVLDIAKDDKFLKCGMINFYGDYFYLNTGNSTQGFEQKKYYDCLKDVDIFASDSDCNNFMVLKREYDLADKNGDLKYGKELEQFKPKDIQIEDFKAGLYNNYYRPGMKRKFDAYYHPDLKILSFNKKVLFNLHSYILTLVCPNHLLFNHEDFEIINKNTLIYKNSDLENMNGLKSALMSLYTGKIQNTNNKVFKILNNVFKIDSHQNLTSLINSKYGNGDAIVKADSKDYSCDPEIMKMSSKFFEYFFQNSKDSKVVDFSNFGDTTIKFLLESMHLLEPATLIEDEHMNIQVFLELLCLSDYLQMKELKKQVEKLILKYYMTSENLVILLMTSHLYKSDVLFKKCCKYIYLNIELLFSDDHVITEIKKYFTFKIWTELEDNLNKFMGTEKYFNEKNWYNKSDCKVLFKKFSSDIKEWNQVFNTNFKLNTDYNNTFKMRTKSMGMSRSSSVSSVKKGINDRPMFKNPFNKSNETLNTKYVSVFNDDDDYSDMGSIASNSSKHRKTSVTLRSLDAKNDLSRRKNNEDEFVMTNTTKAKSNKKVKARTPEVFQPVKVVPGSKPLKKVNNNKRLDSADKMAGSSTKIPLSVIKQGPSLTTILPKSAVKKEDITVVKPVEKAITKELPKLPSLNTNKNTILQKDTKAKVSRRKTKVVDVNTTPASNKTNVPLKKQKDGTLYTNLTLDEMISLANKDKKKSDTSQNVWFQGESNLLNKKLNSGISESISSHHEQNKSNVVSGVSKWDYTRQSYVNNSSNQKLVSLNELYNSKK